MVANFSMSAFTSLNEAFSTPFLAKNIAKYGFFMVLRIIKYARRRILLRETAVFATFLATTTEKELICKGFFKNRSEKRLPCRMAPFFMIVSKVSRLILWFFGTIGLFGGLYARLGDAQLLAALAAASQEDVLAARGLGAGAEAVSLGTLFLFRIICSRHVGEYTLDIKINQCAVAENLWEKIPIMYNLSTSVFPTRKNFSTAIHTLSTLSQSIPRNPRHYNTHI